ncbi:MAG: type II toxin-antitoxin system RelE/ParE family toxin [Nitrospiraceae bacterium]
MTSKPVWRQCNPPLVAPVPHNPKLTMLGYRVLVMDNYLVFYKVKGKAVLVHRILHGANDLLRVLSE